MSTDTDKMYPQFWLHAKSEGTEDDVHNLEVDGACPGDVGDISVTLMDHNRSYYDPDGHHNDHPLGWVNWSDITLSESEDAVIFSLAVDNNGTPDADFTVKVFRDDRGEVHVEVVHFDAVMQISKRPL